MPWTTPGGTPCCCEEPVQDCLTGSSFDAINLWHEITEEQYASIYAGGTWTVSASAALVFSAQNWSADFWIDPVTDEEVPLPLPWTGTSTGSGSITVTDSGGCSLFFGGFFGTPFGSGTYSDNLGLVTPYGTTTAWSFGLNFVRRLGTHNGKRYVSFTNTRITASNPVGSLASATNPATTGYESGRESIALQNVAPLGYTGNFIGIVGGSSFNMPFGITLRDTGQACSPYCDVGNGPTGDGTYAVYDIEETGTITASASFIAAAP